MEHSAGDSPFSYFDRNGQLRISTPRLCEKSLQSLSVDRSFTQRSSTQSVTSNASSVASSSRSTLSRALSTASSMVGQGSSMLSREFESHHRKKRPYNSKSRRLHMLTPESKKDVKRKKRLSPDSIFNDKMSFCCEMECMRKIPLETFAAWREEYVPYSQNRLNEKLMDVIKIGRADLKVRKKFFYPLPSQWRACTAATCMVYGVSVRHFGNLAKLVSAGVSATFRSPPSVPRGWSTLLIPWVEAYAERYGNRMPHRDKIQISVGSKFQIYEKFKFYIDGLGTHKKPISLSTFYKLWPKHIENPKVNAFTKCDNCCVFKNNLGLSGVSYKQRARWMADFDNHLDAQMLERKEYYRRRVHANTRPEEAWCLMVDGMAQYITNVPQFPMNDPKAMFSKKRYDLHVLGVMFHGSSQPQVFVHDSSVATGPNNTIQCIWNAILHRSKTHKLPPLLYIQLDNTASDNKNHHVLEFAAWLVEEGYFEEVIFLTKIFLHL